MDVSKHSWVLGGALLAATLAGSVANELLFERHFHVPGLIGALAPLGTFILSVALTSKSERKLHAPLTGHICCGIIMCIALWTGTRAQLHLPYAVFLGAKSARLVATMFVGMLWLNKVYQWPDLAAAAFAISGLALTLGWGKPVVNHLHGAQPSSSSSTGHTLIATSLLCDGIVANYQEQLIWQHGATSKEIAIYSHGTALLLLLASAATDMNTWTGLKLASTDRTLIALLSIITISGCASTHIVLSMISRWGTARASFLVTICKALAVAVSLIIIPKPVSRSQLIGIGIILACLIKQPKASAVPTTNAIERKPYSEAKAASPQQPIASEIDTKEAISNPSSVSADEEVDFTEADTAVHSYEEELSSSEGGDVVVAAAAAAAVAVVESASSDKSLMRVDGSPAETVYSKHYLHRSFSAPIEGLAGVETDARLSTDVGDSSQSASLTTVRRRRVGLPSRGNADEASTVTAPSSASALPVRHARAPTRDAAHYLLRSQSLSTPTMSPSSSSGGGGGRNNNREESSSGPARRPRLSLTNVGSASKRTLERIASASQLALNVISELGGVERPERIYDTLSPGGPALLPSVVIMPPGSRQSKRLSIRGFTLDAEVHSPENATTAAPQGSTPQR